MRLIRVPERKKNTENDRRLVFEEIMAEGCLELIKNIDI